MHIVIGTELTEKSSPEKVIEAILLKRNITDFDQFLHPVHPLTFSLSLLGFEREREILLSQLAICKKNNQSIVVYTDYDADGITGGSILWETLHTLGFSVFPYVPHRQNEGYGFSVKGIDAVIEKYHPGLIISVDHGISAREQIAYAKSRGVHVIVTDHHTKPELLPDTAIALIHTPLVSGSGLAYITALDLWKSLDPENSKLTDLFTYDFLALASLGTIADLVPLTGYSRSIAKYGLQAFTHATKPGIKELLSVSGLKDMEITTYHAGFALAPRINAVGRLSHALEAVRMFCTKDIIKATRLAHEANTFNSSRQKMVDIAVEEALLSIEKKDIPRLIVEKNNNWNEGIIGLICSKVSDRYKRPSIIMTKTKEGWKGSARSVKGFNIVSFLRSLNILKHVGGHPQAAGFSLTDDQLISFESAVNARMSEVPLPQDREIAVDVVLPFASVSEKLSDELKTLSPYGIGNPTPLFQSAVHILFVKTMGKKQEHIRFVAQDLVEKNKQFECVYFSPSEDQKKLLTTEKSLSLIYSIESQYWQGKKQIKCFIKAVSQVV